MPIGQKKRVAEQSEEEKRLVNASRAARVRARVKKLETDAAAGGVPCSKLGLTGSPKSPPPSSALPVVPVNMDSISGRVKLTPRSKAIVKQRRDAIRASTLRMSAHERLLCEPILEPRPYTDLLTLSFTPGVSYYEYRAEVERDLKAMNEKEGKVVKVVLDLEVRRRGVQSLIGAHRAALVVAVAASAVGDARAARGEVAVLAARQDRPHALHATLIAALHAQSAL